MKKEQMEALENELSKYLRKRRIISFVLTVVFLAVGCLFTAIREATKEVVVHDYGFFSHETVTYNENYVIGILIGFLSSVIPGSVLLTDLLYCGFQTTEANTDYITVYRGLLNSRVYINGKESGIGSFLHVIDTSLTDGTKISVTVFKSLYQLAHISFSDHNPPIDL